MILHIKAAPTKTNHTVLAFKVWLDWGGVSVQPNSYADQKKQNSGPALFGLNEFWCRSNAYVDASWPETIPKAGS